MITRCSLLFVTQLILLLVVGEVVTLKENGYTIGFPSLTMPRLEEEVMKR